MIFCGNLSDLVMAGRSFLNEITKQLIGNFFLYKVQK